MNDNRIHNVFILMSDFIPFCKSIIDDSDLTVDELLTGSAAAIFNVYRSAYDEDAEIKDFLSKLKELVEQHIRECKEGEDNDH